MMNPRQSLFILSVACLCFIVLCSCNQAQAPDSQSGKADSSNTSAELRTPSISIEDAQTIEITQTENNSWTITNADTTIGGAVWFSYPGADQIDFASYFDPTDETADREPVQQVLAALWTQHLGQSAPAPDYIASISDISDLQVSIVTAKGGETHYLFAAEDGFYDIWFQEAILSHESEQTVIERIMDLI